MARSAHRPDPELDLVRYELRRGRHVVRLQKVPMELLILLAEHPGELVTRERIVEHLWAPGVFVDTEHGINTAIRKLRAALGDDATNPRYLQTIIGKGYRLVGPIRIIRGGEILGDGSPPPIIGSNPAAPEGAEPVPPPAAQERPGPPAVGRHVPAQAVVLLLLAAATIGMVAYSSRDAARGGGEDRSVMLAVLPLENLGVEGEEEYLSEGITEELTTELGRVAPRELSVIARSSTQPYRDRTKRVRQIGRELGVDYVLDGTVRRFDDRVRVTTQLIRVSDEAQVWADIYERRLEDVLALREEVASAVAAAVEVKLARRALPPAKPLGLRERELYLRGRFHLRAVGRDSKAKALEYFKAVVAAEPESALGHLGMAETYLRISNDKMPPREAVPAATEAAHRAMQLEPDRADAHLVRAVIALLYEWDWPGAERSVRQALALDPNLAASHSLLATTLSTAGRFDEAVAPARRAYTLDPLYTWWGISAHWQDLAARRWEAALAESERRLELSPGDPGALGTMSLAYQRLGRTTEAVDAARRSLPGGDVPLAACVLAEAGQIEEARQILSQLEARRQRHYVCAYSVAAVHAELGETDRAFELLEQGFRDRSG